jgi:predicted nucleic acid-binding protein
MDLADASLLLLAESLGHGRILITDQRDFRITAGNHDDRSSPCSANAGRAFRV